MSAPRKLHHALLAAAFRAGRQQRPGRDNPHADEQHMIPAAPLRAALWHAFEAGRERSRGDWRGAVVLLRNARFCMQSATR